jgi:phage shock protein PspC (stress-responsive transcriptional regulator)
MEKTVQITIASMQFQVTEHAYEMLRSYLDRLKSHFGDTPDSAEILRDIEARIAEKFIEAKHRLVTDKDVTAVIAEIGDATAFEDSEMHSEQPSSEANTASTSRKLYRNTDDAIIAGVASGIAAYFGLTPLVIRLAFAVSVLFSGVGVIVYILLWLIVPEAKSAGQKLEMKGSAVTLDTIAQVVKDRVEETRERGTVHRIIRFPGEVIRAFSTTVFPLIGRIIGFFLTVGSFLAFIGVSIVLAIVMFNWNASWNDIPHKEFISTATLRSLLVVGYLAIIIPLFFVFSLGQRWFKGRTLVSTAVGFGLLGVWALSLVGSGVLATKIVGDYYAYTSSSPDYAQTIDERAVEAFTAVSVERTHATIVQGDTYSVRIEGRKMDMDNVVVENADGILTVKASPRKREPCLFCHTRTPSVTITVPSLSAITARSGSISLEGVTTRNLTIDTDSASVRGELIADDVVLTLESSFAELDVETKHISITAEHSHMRLDGSATTATVKSTSSNIDGRSFRVNTASIDALSSFVELNASSTLDVIKSDSSSIQNAGTNAGVSEKNEGEF